MLQISNKHFICVSTFYYFRSTVNEDFNRVFSFTQQLISKGDEFPVLVRSNIRCMRYDLLMLTDPNRIVSDFPLEKYFFRTIAFT